MDADKALRLARRRQQTREQRVLAKIESHRDAPPVTVARLTELVDQAAAAGDETIEIVVTRSKGPRRGASIRLMVEVDGRMRRGPTSSGDHNVEHAGGHKWRARWRTADIRRWLDFMGRRMR